MAEVVTYVCAAAMNHWETMPLSQPELVTDAYSLRQHRSTTLETLINITCCTSNYSHFQNHSVHKKQIQFNSPAINAAFMRIVMFTNTEYAEETLDVNVGAF